MFIHSLGFPFLRFPLARKQKKRFKFFFQPWVFLGSTFLNNRHPFVNIYVLKCDKSLSLHGLLFQLERYNYVHTSKSEHIHSSTWIYLTIQKTWRFHIARITLPTFPFCKACFLLRHMVWFDDFGWQQWVEVGLYLKKNMHVFGQNTWQMIDDQKIGLF